MPPAGELRRHQRVKHESAVQVVWKDRDGTEKFTNGLLADISESGMRVRAEIAIDKGTYVGFRAGRLKLQGTGSVRSCTRQGSKFLLGVEFTGGLKWKPHTPDE